MSLACYLSFRGNEITDFLWNDKRCSWVFTDSENLRSDKEALEKGEARVNPNTYFIHIAGFKRQTWNSNPEPRRS